MPTRQHCPEESEWAGLWGQGRAFDVSSSVNWGGFLEVSVFNGGSTGFWDKDHFPCWGLSNSRVGHTALRALHRTTNRHAVLKEFSSIQAGNITQLF